ncbi:alpha/beta hydrolase [Variovorax ginsengisoli]|uniref:Acetyl esterase/lipase n=1 Tax=Variovorax ginsengisoli TaxID=363844 RepID=A0ABT9S7F2_9BURK|nr:alpha/beta hydrolase [Variovorax ginsengisoli]MDP9900285.1 acetyl esterase/lipase [Variovorax ginsengisoli]
MTIPFFPRASRPILAVVALAAAVTLLSACSPVKLVNRLTPDNTFTVQTGIAYGAEPRQQLDVYQPLAQTAPPAGRRPLIVFFYGGTWSHGDRASYKFVGEALAARGAVVVVPDYRLSPQATYPVFVQDSAQAMRWGLDNAARLGADPQRVYVMGHSSGAYNAAMLALDARWLGDVGASPKQLAGWIGLAGPYDFLPIGNPEAQVAFNWPRTPQDSQPIEHATAGSPPALLMAASKDNLVDPVRNTQQMARLLRAAGVKVQTREFDNLSHVTLIGAMAKPIRWIGGPVLPPILSFVGLAPDTTDTIFDDSLSHPSHPSPSAVPTAKNERATQ